MPETLTDAQKVLRNSTGLDMVTQLARIADGVSANINLGLTGAAVGDLVRVAAVDDSGKPTSWNHVPLCDVSTNKNMLDNWDFTNPVNQRGQATWTNAGEYTVDRWKLTSGTASLALDGSGLTLNGTLVQILETAVGQPVTCSAVTDTGEMITPTYDDNTKTFTITATGQKIKAAKLEIGSEQTLAHLENGVRILNELPDYGQELAKCMRWFQRIHAADIYQKVGTATMYRLGRFSVVVPLSCPMAVTGSSGLAISISNIGPLIITSDNEYYTHIFVAGPTQRRLTENAACFNISDQTSYSGPFFAYPANLTSNSATGGGYVDISCEP